MGKKDIILLEDAKNGRYFSSSILHEFDVPECDKTQRSRVIMSKDMCMTLKPREKLDASIDLFDLTDNILQASVNIRC